MDFTLTPEWEDLRTQVRTFIGDEVLYLEEDRAYYDDHEILHYQFWKKSELLQRQLASGLRRLQKTEVGLACLSARGQPFMKRPIDQFSDRSS